MPLVLKNPLCSWWERRADIHINHLARTQASFTISHTFLFLYFALLNKIETCYIQATQWLAEVRCSGSARLATLKAPVGSKCPPLFFFFHMACITLCFTTMPKGFEAHLLIITFPSNSVLSFSCFQMLREKIIQTVDKKTSEFRLRPIPEKNMLLVVRQYECDTHCMSLWSVRFKRTQHPQKVTSDQELNQLDQ